MATFGKKLSDVTEEISLDYVIGIKEIAPGVFQSVKIPQELLTNGAAPADLNAVKARVTNAEAGAGPIAAIFAGKADAAATATALAARALATTTIPAFGFATSDAKLDGTGSIVVPEASAAVAKAGTAGPEGGAMSARQTRTAIDDRVRLTQINTDDYPDLPVTVRQIIWDDAGYAIQLIHSDGTIESTLTGGGISVSAPVLIEMLLLPDSTGSRSPPGMTCTGLDRITRGAFAGCWVVGDDGRLAEGDGSPYVPAVHVLSPDKCKILFTFANGVSGASIQGVAVDTSGSVDTVWVAHSADATIRHYNLYGGSAGAEITGDRLTLSAYSISGSANGLAYDGVNDLLFMTLSTGNTVFRLSCDPAHAPSRLIGTFTLGVAGTDPSNTPDHLHADMANDLLYYSVGSNGSNGTVRYHRLSSGADAIAYGNLDRCQAIEGIYIDRATKRLHVMNDGGYHFSAAPALNIALEYSISLFD